MEKFGVVVPVSAAERRNADLQARLARMARAAERRARPLAQSLGFKLKVAFTAAKNAASR